MENKCLICLEQFETQNTSGESNCQVETEALDSCNALLSKQLRVIFILKNVLGLPTQQLETHLEKFGNPEEWDVTLCSKCSEEVDRIQELFLQLKKTYKLYEDARRKVKMKVSLNSGGDNGDEDNSNGFWKFLKVVVKTEHADDGDDEDDDRDEWETQSVNKHDYADDCPEDDSMERMAILKEGPVSPFENDQNDDDDHDHIPEHTTTQNEVTYSVPKLTKEESENLLNPVPEKKKPTRKIIIENGRRKYVCLFEDCGKAYLDRKSFRAHSLRHEGSDPEFQCTDCGKMYYTRRCLYEHRKRYHGKSTPTVAEFLLNDPAKSSREGDCNLSYRCGYEGCTNAYKTRVYFLVHMAKHEGKSPTLQCPECNKCLYFPEELRRHRYWRHGIRAAKEKHLEDEEDDNVSPTPCPKCGKSFNLRSELESHLERCGRKRLICPKCNLTCYNQFIFDEHVCPKNKITENRPVKAKAESNSRKKYICTHEGCGKVYLDSGCLRAHTARHQSKVPQIQCADCGRWYYTKRNLYVHWHASHRKKKDADPDLNDPEKEAIKAGRDNPGRSSAPSASKSKPERKRKHPRLYNDNIIIHNGIQMFKCNFQGCTSIYKQRRRFSAHMAQHEGKPPTVQCPDCDERFYITEELHKHRDKKHGPKDPGGNLCPKCGKSWETLFQLKTHIRRCGKKRIKCDTCGQRYESEKGFQNHTCGSNKPKR